MGDSILVTTKKNLGVAEDDTSFDVDILTHINSVLSVLNQVGVGPVDGFMIEDAVPTWDDFLGSDKRYNAVKTYVYLKVRMYFDPPTTAHLINAMEKQAEELEYRLNVHREVSALDDVEEEVVFDGGSA